VSQPGPEQAPAPAQQAFLLQFNKEIAKHVEAAADSPAERVAQRLQKRVTARFGSTPSVASLANAIRTRADLLARSVLVTFDVTGTPDTAPTPVIVASAEHAHWIAFSLRGAQPSFTVDKDVIARDIEADTLFALPRSADGIAAEAPDAWGNKRMTLSGVPKSGYVFDAASVAASIASALQKNSSSVSAPIAYRPAGVILPDGRTLELLATGHSDFQTSPAGRKANVRKGLEERLNGVLIPAGSTFSFNSILGKGVSKASGWQDSLVIKDGYRLVPEPGGGICQVATTFYRAALLAGLPIPVRKNHSLYVHYYELFGVGLDATVYIGAQDLKAVNDTGNDLFVQAYIVGTDGVVKIYGIADGRSVAMRGPYFTDNAPENLLTKPLRANQIAWTRTITRSDGQARDEVIVSNYNSIPRSVPAHYADLDVVAEMHAAAPLPPESVTAME
jgi:vancomycin resistance protein YoaR